MPKLRLLIPIFINIVPSSVFFFMITDISKAMIGTFIIIVCTFLSLSLSSGHNKKFLSSFAKLLADVRKRLDDIRDKTETDTVAVIDLLQNIVRKSKEGSEEAAAVVAYFMGRPDEKTDYFGDSYVSRMLRENEASVSKAGSVFRNIEEINRNFLDNLKAVFDKVEAIHRFVKDIREIAFQTRLLSLNAAIEAARAGENGLSFSVVADEVRKLADRSGGTASQISDIVEDSMKIVENIRNKVDQQVNAGILAMVDTEHNLKNTFDKFRKSVDSISDAIKVLTLNYQTISKDIENATISLQFQDIISQEMDKINTDMIAFKDEFESSHSFKKTAISPSSSAEKRLHKKLPAVKEHEDNVEFF